MLNWKWGKKWGIKPIIIAIICCYIFDIIGIPVAWLIGSLLVGVGYALFMGKPQPLPNKFLTLGKAIIGIAAAARFSPTNLLTVATYIIPLLLALGLTGGLSMLNGYLIHRWSGIKLVTSLLGSIPGTASANVAISSEFGADPPVVAVLQYLRLLMVALLVPLIAGFISNNSVVPDHTGLAVAKLIIAQPASPIWNLAVISLCCVAGIWLGKTLNLPTKGFLGTFLCGIPLFGFFPGQYNVSQPIVLMALLLIGLSAGLKFNWHHISGLGRAMVLEIGLVLWLIGCCLGIGYALHYWTDIDLTTAVLAFAPGGMEAMIATSNQLGGDTGLVLTIKFIHQLSIIFTVNFMRSYMNPQPLYK